MPDTAIELEGEGKYIMVITAVTYNKRTIWFIGQNFLCCFTRDWTPIPAILKIKPDLNKPLLFYLSWVNPYRGPNCGPNINSFTA